MKEQVLKIVKKNKILEEEKTTKITEMCKKKNNPRKYEHDSKIIPGCVILCIHYSVTHNYQFIG